MAASIGLHGLLLGWPLPSETPEEPQVLPPPPEESVEVDVTILPAGAIAANGQDDETAIADEDVEDPLEVSPESVGRSSTPAPVERSPEISEVVPENTVPTPEIPTEPTQPAADTDPLPNDQLPDEPGSTGLTGGAPDPATTLATRLGDVGAYQYNGQKGLDLLQSLSAQDGWATPGQTLPSKAEPLELPYQLGAQCLNTAPVSGLLMAVVNPDQTFARGPEVVGSTGYAILDEQAVAMVETGEYIFPDEDEPWAYNVEIKVLYPGSCP
ncbi:MAG: hypothetical protein ACFB0G_00380 [Leptolyngbyaceae cyanobacterium]